MNRLTQKDEQGNWCLRGLRWDDLREGKVITRKTYERLYGALHLLMEYEETGLSPEQIQEMDWLYVEKCRELAEEKRRHRWISAEASPKDGYSKEEP